MTDDRAQAEALGFSTVLGVVGLMVLIVSLTVAPAISDLQKNQQVSNVERGMESFAENVDDLIRNDAPSRSTRLRLGGGQVSLGEPVTLTVSNGSETVSRELRPLVYRSRDGTELVYVNGAVIRAEDGGVAVVREPELLVSDESLLFPVVRLEQGDGPTGVSGTTRVVTTRTAQQLPLAEPVSSNATVTVTSPRATAWARILDAAGFSCSPPSGDTVTCETDTDHVSVSVIDVEVAFR